MTYSKKIYRWIYDEIKSNPVLLAMVSQYGFIDLSRGQKHPLQFQRISEADFPFVILDFEQGGEVTLKNTTQTSTVTLPFQLSALWREDVLGYEESEGIDGYFEFRDAVIDAVFPLIGGNKWNEANASTGIEIENLRVIRATDFLGDLELDKGNFVWSLQLSISVDVGLHRDIYHLEYR